MVCGRGVPILGDPELTFLHTVGTVEFSCINCGVLLSSNEVVRNNHVTSSLCCKVERSALILFYFALNFNFCYLYRCQIVTDLANCATATRVYGSLG